MDKLNQLPGFPPVAKLFVALFTSLMLLVALWAAWIYTVEKGEVDADHLPAYLNESAVSELSAEDELDVIAADSGVALAPRWDTELKGEDVPIDSTEMVIMEASAEAIDEATKDEPEAYEDYEDYDDYEEEGEGHLRHNLGLAHVHINGQTLLFFALGAVFLFTSVKRHTKIFVLWTFGLTILAHAVGLSGEGFHWLFDDILALSGVVMLLLIAYMCLMIYVDLGRSRKKAES